MARGNNKTTTRDIARHWSNGRNASAGAFMTDGKNLFSYRLLIGTTITDPDTGRFKKVLFDYTSEGGYFKSMTTSKHVGLAKQFATEVRVPPEDEIEYDIILRTKSA